MAKKVKLLIWLFLFSAASVGAQSINVITIQELDFGDTIFPGIEKTILFTDSNAAQFEITGEPDREVLIQFQLPEALEDQQSNSLDISFSTSDAGYHSTVSGAMNATVFNPNSGTTATLNSEGKLYVWVGATAMPLHTQAGNYYQENLILEVDYTL
ncbi:MAG: hypothetical protein WD059_08870 [Balneolaceae bacterium]